MGIYTRSLFHSFLITFPHHQLCVQYLPQGRIACAPFFYVTFADFWVAEQLVSLIVVLMDTEYFFCYLFFAQITGQSNSVYNTDLDCDSMVAIILRSQTYGSHCSLML